MIHTDDLRYLSALHAGGSLAAAGRALGVDATTVGRRLAAAERALGARLFTRAPEGFRPTDAGLRALAAAQQVSGAVESLMREVGGADARVVGTVRVTSGEGVVLYALAPALPDLLSRHPLLQVELMASSRPLDLLRGEADVALRLFRPREPGLVARRAGALRYGLYAAPSYLRRAGTPRTLAELARHDAVGFDSSLASIPEMRWLSARVPPERVRVRTSSTAAVLAACRAGVGIAAVAELFAAGDPGLSRILPRVSLPAREAWLVTHPDLRRSARVSAVTAWIAGLLGEGV